jgi:hypothetical protein
VARRLSDLDVYAMLQSKAAELDAAAAECWSVSGETALKALADAHRKVASGVYAASLSGAVGPASG